MGLGLSFAIGEGPKFATVVRDEAAVNALEVPDMATVLGGGVVLIAVMMSITNTASHT